jgi:hypothetical protein
LSELVDEGDDEGFDAVVPEAGDSGEGDLHGVR